MSNLMVIGCYGKGHVWLGQAHRLPVLDQPHLISGRCFLISWAAAAGWCRPPHKVRDGRLDHD